MLSIFFEANKEEIANFEAKKVFLLLKKFNIHFKILTWRGKKPTKNIQAIARD